LIAETILKTDRKYELDQKYGKLKSNTLFYIIICITYIILLNILYFVEVRIVHLQSKSAVPLGQHLTTNRDIL